MTQKVKRTSNTQNDLNSTVINLQLIKIMNYIFGEDEFEKSKYDVLESSYKLEYFSIDTQRFESLNDSLKQLNGFELPQHEYKFESISEKADFGEDYESVSDFMKKNSCSNCDITPDPLSYNKETLDYKSPNLNFHSNKSIEEDCNAIKESTIDLELVDLQSTTLDLIDKEIVSHIIDDKIESEESKFSQTDQLVHQTKS